MLSNTENWTIRKSCLASFSILLMVAAGACGVAEEEEDSGPTPPLNPPEGVVDDSAGFYLRAVQSDDYTYITHLEPLSNFGEDCVASSGEDVNCYMEAMEGDLYFHGLSLQFNVPSSMCEYVAWRPYYYFKFEPGVCVASAGYTDNGDGTITQGAIAAAPAGCADWVSGVADAYCKWDYSHEAHPLTGGDGPNCCEGTLTLTQSGGTTLPTTKEWEGKISNCLDGPAVETQAKTQSGFPMTDIHYVAGTGINKVYHAGSSAIEQGLRSNSFHANYYDTLQHGGPPLPILAVQDYVANDGAAAVFDGGYTLACLDRAFEIKARINLFVREWNTRTTFNNRSTCTTASTCWDVGGYVDTETNGTPVNDFWDHWDFEAYGVDNVLTDQEKFPGIGNRH